MILDIIAFIKDLDKRLRVLETGTTIRNLTLPDDGSFVLPNLASDPASGVRGQIYYNTTSEKYRGYNGSTWVDLS